MTNKEAIRFASSLMDNSVVNDNDLEAFCDMAIKALEKQIPKKPIFKRVGAGSKKWHCPACDGILSDNVGTALAPNFCEYCGQRICYKDDDIPMEYWENGGI